MEQLVAIVAVCRLAILKRMPATPLTLLVAHRVREQVKVQVQRSGKMKIWGGSRTQRANILSSQIAFCEKGELYIEYRRMSCKERSGKLCKFCEKDETTSAPLPTRRPYPDYGKLPNFHYLSWSATPTDGREPDDFQPRAQIKRLFEESELVSGDSEAIRRFSDKYIVPEKLVAEYVEHLAQIKMRKEKKKEETETGANGTAEPGLTVDTARVAKQVAKTALKRPLATKRLRKKAAHTYA
ncbi:hypothetical protein AWC38_SpisGene20605 [Stylophora pistillata]|uniref:Uncharacterized protein n=1 Tax=Stylophora pistillata TaxID=50429 RepID=A0A2B4RC14_STYPI|nr:hypothetical protein AWC38_SpisGene20605 [Stylophora pistillata]